MSYSEYKVGDSVMWLLIADMWGGVTYIAYIYNSAEEDDVLETFKHKRTLRGK